MNKAALHCFEFGPFCLNVTERLLQREGEVVPLTPKLIDTLVILVEHQGHVVAKDELMQTLWPDSFVEESSLTQNISLLRKALTHNGNGVQYIETIPKRGYRFVAAVRELEHSNGDIIVDEPAGTADEIEDKHRTSEPDNGHGKVASAGLFNNARKYMAACAAVIILAGASVVAYRWNKERSNLAASKVSSIAVLPFQSIGPRSENDVIGLGMANALIIKLSHLNQTKVLPTSSVSKYVARTQDAAQIGRELGVDAVLDGTVQRDGDRVRVTGHMIRSSDGMTIWSGKYDTNYQDIFGLQDAISEEVGAAMIPNLRKDARDQLANHLTDNQEAYEAYVTGFHFWNKRTKENLSKAIHFLELATQKDQNFARAHALLADAYFLGSQDGYELMSFPESLVKAQASVQRALELDDTIAEAHTTKGNIAFSIRDHEQAEREFRRALEPNPNLAVAHLRYGYFLFGNSQLNEGLAEMKRAVELDPVSAVSHTALGFMLSMTRDFDGAMREYKKAIVLQPDLLVPHINLGEVYAHQQMFPEALAECDLVDRADPLWAKILRAHVYGITGRREEAQR